jgi:hypothetical protein
VKIPPGDCISNNPPMERYNQQNPRCCSQLPCRGKLGANLREVKAVNCPQHDIKLNWTCDHRN